MKSTDVAYKIGMQNELLIIISRTATKQVKIATFFVTYWTNKKAIN